MNACWQLSGRVLHDLVYVAWHDPSVLPQHDRVTFREGYTRKHARMYYFAAGYPNRCVGLRPAIDRCHRNHTRGNHGATKLHAGRRNASQKRIARGRKGDKREKCEMGIPSGAGLGEFSHNDA